MKDENAKGDPYKTVIVSNLEKKVTEKQLRREFERYGRVTHASVVLDKKTGKSRGYGFVSFDTEKDFKRAYNEANGQHFCGKKIYVDREKGRITSDWLPRRLGGGKGKTRANPKIDNIVKELKEELGPLKLEREVREREREREERQRGETKMEPEAKPKREDSRQRTEKRRSDKKGPRAEEESEEEGELK